MIEQTFIYPFHHTILYDYFDDGEMECINDELGNLLSNSSVYIDEHHKKLFNESKTKSLCLDSQYDDRNKSFILNKIRKIYDLYLHRVIGDKNPFLNYIPLSNYDQTFIQYYYNGSDYFEHHDGAILTILYVLYDKESKFDGGEFVFTKYRYKPYLTNNCCIIFPSYEIHKVEKIFSEEKEKPVRYSINQRIWIK